MLQEAVRRIVKENDIEIIVFGVSGYLVGYPPVDTGATCIFDYVDYSNDGLLAEYLGRADAIICASRALQLQVERLGRDAVYIPNGVDFERLSQANGLRIREHYRIGDNLVISLIGLTCSPDLYFAKSLFRVYETVPNARFLFVGKGALYRPLRHALRSIQQACIWTGWIGQERIYDYFLATDIGLYPGADNEYFRAACPIKILEYSAAGRPVVSSPVEEVDRLGLSNVVQVEATAEGFFRGIQGVLETQACHSAESLLSWEQLANQYERFLMSWSMMGDSP